MIRQKVLFTMWLDEGLYQKLRYASFKEHKPASKIVREAISEVLGEERERG